MSATKTSLRKKHHQHETIAFNEVNNQFTTSPSDKEIQNEWANFKNKHGKQYNSRDESQKYKKFHDNYNYIAQVNAEHQAKGKSLRLGVNSFADMDQNEFEAYSRGTIPESNQDNQASFVQVTSETEQLPSSVDWTASGTMNGVKNQGACGSCWAFSAIGALEAFYKLSVKLPNQLFSEQQIIDCTNRATSTWGMYGCSGGAISTAFRYIANQSTSLASKYPYTASNGTCKMNSSIDFGWKNKGYSNVFSNNSITLKTAVAKQPVSVSLWASTTKFQLYKSGVYFEDGCGISNGVYSTNHGVVITGYGQEQSSGSYYWIIQNSWGTGWGNQGYIWIGYTPDALNTTNTNPGTCGIHQYPQYPN